jgi:hypothetical protein
MSNIDSQTDAVSTEEETPSHTTPQQSQSWFSRLVPNHIQRIFLPDDPERQLLDGEELQIEIHLAWYRNIAAELLFNYPFIILMLTIVASVLAAMVASSISFNVLVATLTPWGLLIGFCLYALYQRFNYLQWRLVKTNKRIIMTMPQSGSWYLVDTIEMNSMPRVLDANWADSGLRRSLQALTGARDLYISLVGLQFEEGTSKVKDAIVMPDVNNEDADKLKALVFGG